MPTPRELRRFRARAHAPYVQHVTGRARGTTDELIAWAAWKWGIDEDLVRAVATVESGALQGFVGDHGRSYGIMQTKRTAAGDDQGWPGTYPLSRESTAFNLDFWGRAFRSCFDGRDRWLRTLSRRRAPYRPGDLWGCLGVWFSGGWYDAAARRYVGEVRAALRALPWRAPEF
jgi:autotransporter family porin